MTPRLPAPNKPEAKGPPLSDEWWHYALFLLGVAAIAYYVWTT